MINVLYAAGWVLAIGLLALFAVGAFLVAHGKHRWPQI